MPTAHFGLCRRHFFLGCSAPQSGVPLFSGVFSGVFDILSIFLFLAFGQKGYPGLHPYFSLKSRGGLLFLGGHSGVFWPTSVGFFVFFDFLSKTQTHPSLRLG